MPDSLEKLHEDILLRILVLTDIYTVLTLSQINSFFHAIASTKQLWVFLIRDLFLRGLIDIPSDEVFTLSTDELVAEVKRAVLGPRTWSSSSSTTPTLIRQFTVPLEVSRVAHASLLPGGRYIMVRLTKWFEVSESLECWNVSTGRFVWSWNRPDFGILEFAFDTRPGSKLTVALNIYRLSQAYSEVLILEVNLESGHSREITRFSGKHIYETQIAGDYLCCNCSWKNNTWLPLLVNHRTEQYQYIAIEECPTTPVLNLHLVPGHIVVINPQPVPISVRVYAISSLWRPLSEFNPQNMTHELALTPTALFPVVGGAPISRGIPHHRKERVFLVESLLRRHTYLLRGFDMVSLHQDPHVPNNITTISTQRLEFSEGRTSACTPVSTLVQSPFIGEVEAMNMYFSRAGYAVDGKSSSGNRVYVFQPEDCTARGIELDVGGHRAQHVFLGHNGGLVVLHESGAGIFYYD